MNQPDEIIESLVDGEAFWLGRHTHECGYFKDRNATEEAWLSAGLPPEVYKKLMNMNFRRSGQIIYRPVCGNCKLCVPIRIPVAEFKPSKSQRKALNRNSDVSVVFDEPELTIEKHQMYERYLLAQHGKTPQSSDIESMRDFLYQSCVDTIEACYRDANNKLLGVSILDVSEDTVSSVYHYFEPDEPKRSMGVYSMVKEIQYTVETGRKWNYLGFWIQGCRAMEYKADYKPYELLIDGKWQAG